jgi:putative heme-binding domain-containing protein
MRVARRYFRETIEATFLVAALLASPASAAESWADPNMTVRDGLELWLDGTHATADEMLANGALREWADASGKGRHLRQAEKQSQPIAQLVGTIGIVRFDGVDDHLRAVQTGGQLRPFTLVIVAAPRHNLGAFRAFLALNAAGERDYTSGLTIDLGPSPGTTFNTLNVEGRGFVGAQNLRTSDSPFFGLHSIAVISDTANNKVRLRVDNAAEGQRPREAQPLSCDEVTVGARYYNNGAGPQHVDGFGRSDIAEVLLYSRELSSQELAQLQKYIDAKYGLVKNALPPAAEDPLTQLEPVKNPPPVQVFLPGFTTRELPLELTNINNVKYREDGTLVAMGYDGNIWLLRDTNNDGLEDKAEPFWKNDIGLRSPIGMDLTPPGYERGNGLFVVGKTRCLLIVDTDNDDKADNVIDVAGGWKESFHQVDGLGVAFDKRDGSVYYGRGTYNFADPMLRDKDGKAQFSLADESAAVIRVSPDFKKREIVATGIRFPVSLRFNSAGDLFATDQEGATWVPNGNPFDELLHVERGRHYGFPPRHPKDLPNVIDEPSTFDYAPQHQSTCGLNFNEPVRAGGPIFGPAAWAGDALVTGYSRGKLYRTQLVKSPAGYVARNHLLACLNMLTVDACVDPQGQLVVACHSGGPDWGSGPTGQGKLLKISYSDPDHPQPVLCWTAGPRELRVEFDRPVDPQLLHDVRAKAKLTGGRYVRAGDRFESIAPGYAAVQAQKIDRRFDVPIRSAQLTPDGRTLVLATDPMTEGVHYALELPGMGRPTKSADKTLAQHAAVDIDFDLSGCEATWTPAGGGPAWTGWLPHWDLEVSQRLTAGSAPHDALWAALEKPGELTLRGKLDLTDMLRPAIQPGSKIDYEYPPESVTLTFHTTSQHSQLTLVVPQSAQHSRVNDITASFTLPVDAEKIIPVELRMTARGGTPALHVAWTTNEDDRRRSLPLRRLFLPWADTSGKTAEPVTPAPPKELEGGSWARGYREFFGEQAACSKCHTIHGRGGTIGPDLSNLVHRDYASVLRDVAQPSFAINPDYLSYTAVLKEGRVLTGVVHTAGDELSIGDAKGNVTKLARSEIEELHPTPVSTMPEDLPKVLGSERMRDLLTFLLTPGPQMPRDHPGPRPKPRTLAEIVAALAGAPDPPLQTRPINVLLVSGPKDHGVGEHDYPAFQRAWAELLAIADGVEVAKAWEWPSKEQFQKADIAVFYQHGNWDAARSRDVDAFLARGAGLVYIHWAVDGQKGGRDFADRIGLAAGAPIAFRHGPLDLVFDRGTKHPIIRNFDRLQLEDESYWKLTGSLPAGRALATSLEDNAPQPQLWTLEHGPGRVFVCIPGHYSWSFDDPLFRLLLLRGIAWTAHEPIDRFNELIWPGADVAQ